MASRQERAILAHDSRSLQVHLPETRKGTSWTKKISFFTLKRKGIDLKTWPTGPFWASKLSFEASGFGSVAWRKFPRFKSSCSDVDG